MEGLHESVVRVWIPIPSLGWVNAYLFRGPLVLDPGMMSARSILSLSRGLRARGYSFSGIEAVVLTHFHVDHSTMTVLLESEASPRVMIGWRDLEVIRRGVDEFVSSAIELIRENGAPESIVEEITRAHPALRMRWAYEEAGPDNWEPLREGDRVRLGNGEELVVLETPGHTPGSIVLYSPSRRLVYTGDTLLPGITPHVTLHSPDSDPLGEYMESLKKLAGLGARAAFPGHRGTIEGPGERAREILEHHRARLREVLSILESRGPMTGYDVARSVKWRARYSSWEEYPAPEKFFALSEALAHLRRLEVEGLVERVERNRLIYWKKA